MVNAVTAITEVIPVTIADGESLSPAVNLGGRVLVGVEVPASWTAASLTFQACSTADGTYTDLYDSAGEVAITTMDSSRYISLPSDTFLGVKHLKLRSGVTATPVAQSGDITINLLVASPSGR